MDNNLPDLKANETVQEDLSSLDKLTQSYLLLKKKICGTNELIKQYNDKLKECERLKTDLDATSKEAKKVTCNYNSTLAKVIKLELQNTEYKKNIQSLTQQAEEHKVKTAADQQHIQQLICKIKDLEKNEDSKIMQYDLEKSSLQVKIKELEQELKSVKKSYDTKIKKIEKKVPVEHDKKPKLKEAGTNTVLTIDEIQQKPKLKEAGTNTVPTSDEIPQKPKVKEAGTNTVLTSDEIQQKPKVAEKCVMTHEQYSVKDDVYPVFCGKCEVLLEPPPLEKICKIMTNSCPKLIEKISSPKKVLPPPPAPPEVNCYEPKNSTLPNTSSPLKTQNNHPNFVPMNLLSPQVTATPNRSEYCNNFAPVFNNSMNPGAYYIGPMPVNTVPLPNLNTTNQNSDSMATVASSLSIISSLQKKIDSLETKIEKLNKAKSRQSSDCCQHHPNTCMYDMNSSMQFNFMEMWKRMADFYENRNKERDHSDTHKRHNKKLNNYKVPRLKTKKRLQNAHTDRWKVETFSRKVERSPSRKRPKKRKNRYSSLFDDADDRLNNSEDPENLNSDSDTNSYAELFLDNTNSKTDTSMGSKNSSCTEMSKSPSKSNTSKTPTCSNHSTDIDEVETVETIRNSVESNKSVGGETDSGILSDSIESNKLTQLDADIDTCHVRKNITKVKSSIGNKSFIRNVKLVKPKLPERPQVKALHLTESNKPKEDTGPKTSTQSNECNEKDKNVTKVLEDDKTVENTASTSTGTTGRKRKIDELQEQRNFNNRVNLLKKIRNIRRCNRTINSVSQNTSHHQDIQNCEIVNSRTIPEKNLDDDRNLVKVEDYTPKKRPRIAHVPKSTVTDHTYSLSNSLQVRKSVEKNVEDTEPELQIISANSENNQDTIADKTILQDTDSNLTKLKKTNKELEEENSDKTEQLKAISLNRVEPVTEKSAENNSEVTSPDIINVPSGLETNSLSNVDLNSCKYSNSIIESDNDSVKEIAKTEPELNSSECLEPENDSDHSDGVLESEIFKSVQELVETVTELEKQCKSLDQVNESTSLPILESKTPVKEKCIKSEPPPKDHNVHENFIEEPRGELDFSDNKSNDSMNVSNTSTPKNNVTCNADIVQITEPCSSNNPVLNEKKEDCVKNQVKKETKVNTKKSKKPLWLNSKVSSKSPYALQKLKQYINENQSPRTYQSQYKQILPIRLLTDKYIRRQLQRLMDNEWEASVHWDVIEKLKCACSPRIIAKGIVEFLSTETGEQLDKSHTPPAPLMTKTQQRIVALLVDLGESEPTIFQFVQAGIEYKLFRLNQTIMKQTIESLARMYTILARIKKDREKVRIFCCDALYCLGLNAIIVLYTVLTCWPEVFPNNETSSKLLPRCMAHIITSHQAVGHSKLNALKNLVSIFYKYPTGTLSTDLLNELLTALQTKSHTEVETSLILLAKKEGTTWTYKNIIRGALLPMIINNKVPSIYRAFWLLGNLMRVFPIEDKDNSVGQIVEQLCDLVNSGSDEQNEGVISALLSLSRHKFDEVVQNTLKWDPAVPLRDRTKEQFNGLFNQRNTDFWKNYLRRNRHLFETRQESKT